MSTWIFVRFLLHIIIPCACCGAGGSAVFIGYRLLIPGLEPFLQNYIKQGIATSTRHSYSVRAKHFHEFCVLVYLHEPFPLMERVLCYFATYLAVNSDSESSTEGSSH